MSKRLPRHGFFINLINGRCGSTLLTTYLNQIPDIISYPEVLAALDEPEQEQLLDRMIQGESIEEINPIAASEVYYPTVPLTAKSSAELAAVGMKTKYGDVANLPGLITLMREHKFSILFMVRANMLKTVLSRLRAEVFYKQYGDYNVTAPDQKVPPIHINLDQFTEMLAKEQRYIDDLNHIVGTSGRPHLKVSYESLVADPVTHLNRILIFLKSSYWIMPNDGGTLRLMNIKGETVLAPMVMRIHKMTSDRISDAIINYDEFHARFSKTQYAEFLS